MIERGTTYPPDIGQSVSSVVLRGRHEGKDCNGVNGLPHRSRESDDLTYVRSFGWKITKWITPFL